MGTFAILLSCFMVILPLSVESNEPCDTPQYLEVGKSGIIKCSFEDGLYAIAWYTSESLAAQTPLARLVNGVKIGEKISTGELDLRADGSLVINNVTLLHDTNFTVFVFPSKSDNPSSVIIESIVLVKPSVTFPVIEVCRGKSVCYTQVKDDFAVSCHIANSRPALNLKWVARTFKGDLHLSSKSSIFSNDGTVFTSQAVTKDIFTHSTFLSLLVCCMVDDIPGMMLEDESAIFIENSENGLSAKEPIVKHVAKGSTMKLTCSNENISLIVWKKADMPSDEFQVISYATYTKNGFSKTSSNSFMLQDDGSLFVLKIGSQQEGLYACIYESEYNGGIVLYEVIVYVHVQPVVQGCIRHTHCVLNGQRVGNLTCSVKGIRPEVNLEWKTFSEQDSSLIIFTDHQLTTSSKGDVFDVTLNSKYQLNDPSTSRITIQCITTKVNTAILESSANFDLRFHNVQPTDEKASPSNRHLLWLLMIIIPFCLVFIVLWRLHIKRSRQKRNRRMRNNFHQEEGTPMISSGTTQVEPTSDFKSDFVRQLKTKYKYQYDAVQPIPYIRDRLYCVDRVFVEGGLKKLISKTTTEGLGNWEKMSSYHDVTNLSSSSTRTIIEGDPGYGKSTLTLQLAYDWCNCNDTSPLAEVDILILLRLRQLGGIHSLFRAIKQFILPRDSQFSETDIQNFLKQSKSTVFILDGFDEYPEQETEDLNDIISTIRGEMFQENFVILTSRSFFLPKSYPPQTHRIRLTGFDSNVRDAYIRKAVVGDNTKAAEKIKRSLQKNSVLQGLCQVPLFFVMFAHMTHESEKFLKFKSVTSFFKYMITCFHSHMKNKMEDRNVKTLDLHEHNHANLDKVAFEGLSGKNQQIVWSKEDLIQRLGEDFYNQYRSIGILVEEEVLDISDRVGDIQYKTEVRFYHKLFCEWYAAHYLCDEVLKHDSDLHKLLEYINPFDLQYTYRFACGLNPNAGNKIIEYIRGVKDGDKFAVLCILEQSGNFDQIKETVQDLCCNYVTIDNTDSLLLQGSIVRLLEIGSSTQIPISFVWLKECFNSVDLSAGSILLKSELSIPALSTLQELVIQDRGRNFTNEELSDVIKYSTMCSGLKSLRFCYSLMPKSIEKTLCASLQPRRIQVLWCTDEADYLLSHKSGKWEPYDTRSSKNFFEGNIPAKKNLLKTLMKNKYKALTSAVPVIPSDSENLLPVNEVFVNCPLQCMVNKDKDKSNQHWIPMNSYQVMFTDNVSICKRYVLEGKPGFGKSMLALRMAYDWCEGITQSPLSGFDLFLLVQFTPANISKSIYTEIKRRALPRDSPLSDIDIRSVLRECTSAVMVLDGIDLCSYQLTDEKCDVRQIIRGKMFKDIEVIITSTFVPKECMPGTNRFRLTGFDDKARDEYIRKLVASSDRVTIDKTKQLLSERSALEEILHIPWFFTTYTYVMSKNVNDTSTVKTAKYSIPWFTESMCSHIKNNKNQYNEREPNSLETNLAKFYKFAFECLCKTEQTFLTNKEQLHKIAGKECYDRLVRLGILCEEEIVKDDAKHKSNVIQYGTDVIFSHKLFEEWCGAHYVAKHADGQQSEKIKTLLNGLNLHTALHLCCFACELNIKVASSLINLMKGTQFSEQFTTILIFEFNIQADSIANVVKDLCSRKIYFNDEQEEIHQTSLIHLLKIACKEKISISWVYLSNCYSTVDLRGGNHLQLKSNLSIPVLTTLNKLTINADPEGKEITSEEFTGILQYSSQCLALKELKFWYCLLPPSVQLVESVSVLRSRNVKVQWNPRFSLSGWYCLNLTSGRWERGYYGGDGEMTDRDYKSVVEEIRKEYRR